MKLALIYGSATGKTEFVAEQIVENLEPEYEVPMLEIADLEPSDLVDYDFLILGIPTWDIGEYEHNWADFVDKLGDVDYSGVKIAIFGLGDQDNYADTYQDAMGMLYNDFLKQGATGNIGFTSTEGHTFDASRGIIDGQFCGLAIDDDVQPDMTEERVEAWAAQLKEELGEIFAAV